jgi:hypothetical protein
MGHVGDSQRESPTTCPARVASSRSRVRESGCRQFRGWPHGRLCFKAQEWDIGTRPAYNILRRGAHETSIADRGAGTDGARRDVRARRRTERTPRTRHSFSDHTCVHGRGPLLGSGHEHAVRFLSTGEKRPYSDRQRWALPRRFGSRPLGRPYGYRPANRFGDRASHRSRGRRPRPSGQLRHRHRNPLAA